MNQYCQRIDYTVRNVKARSLLINFRKGSLLPSVGGGGAPSAQKPSCGDLTNPKGGSSGPGAALAQRPAGPGGAPAAPASPAPRMPGAAGRDGPSPGRGAAGTAGPGLPWGIPAAAAAGAGRGSPGRGIAGRAGAAGCGAGGPENVESAGGVRTAAALEPLGLAAHTVLRREGGFAGSLLTAGPAS